jgi:hypothetical protein
VISTFASLVKVPHEGGVCQCFQVSAESIMIGSKDAGEL